MFFDYLYKSTLLDLPLDIRLEIMKNLEKKETYLFEEQSRNLIGPRGVGVQRFLSPTLGTGNSASNRISLRQVCR